MDPKDWKAGLIDTVTDFASSEYQERVWRRGEGPEVSSYGEAREFFFGLYMPEEHNQRIREALGFDDHQVNSLIELGNLLDEFAETVSDSPSASEVLDNPGWSNVREAARRALDAIKEPRE